MGSETDKKLIFDYYYGGESEQFTFYRIPKLLVTDAAFKGLSSDSKLLYGLMLDRLSLSRMNGWYDEHNRVYIIYTAQEIMEDLNCGNQKAAKLVKELADIGLITKKRRGLGQADLTYVMNFITATEDMSGKFEKSPEKKPSGKKDKEKPSKAKESKDSITLTDLLISHDKRCENHTSGNVKTGLSVDVDFTPEKVCESHTINNNPNNTDSNDIHLSIKTPMDGSDIEEVLDRKIKDNLQLGHYLKYGSPDDKEFILNCYELISEIVKVERSTIRINGHEYPYGLVRKRFLEVTDEHLLYVKESLDRTTTDIKDIRSYMITAIFNAPATINSYYNQQVRHDQGRYEEPEPQREELDLDALLNDRIQRRITS